MYFTPIIFILYVTFNITWSLSIPMGGCLIGAELLLFIIVTVSDALMEQIAIARNGKRINVVRIPSKR